MRLAPLLLAISACGEGAADKVFPASPEPRWDQGGRIIDTADVLDGPAEARIATRLRDGQQADGRSVVVVTLRPSAGDSMERIGWAIGGANFERSVTLMLIDPDAARVRIENGPGPEGSAAIASAMQADLRAKRFEPAIVAGLRTFEQLAP